MTQAKKAPITLQIAIASVPLLMMGVSAMTPVLATIQNAFPDVPATTINLVQTMPSLFTMVFALLAGMIAGRGKITYKRLVLFAIAIQTIGGIMPFFTGTSSFEMLLVSRAIFGIGNGIIFPMGQMLVYEYVQNKAQHTRILSNNSLIMNIGGCFFQYAAGFLALINWQYVFLSYLLGVVSFVLVLVWLKKPENDFAEAEDATSREVEEKLPLGESFKRIPAFVWICLIFFGLSIIIGTPVTILASSYAEYLGESPVTASTILVFYTIGGFVMGFLFPFLYKVTKRFSIAFALIVEAVAYFIMFFGGSVVTACIGELLAGAGIVIWQVSLQKEIGLFCPRGADSLASSIMMCLMNLGLFVGGFWGAFCVGFVGSDFIFDSWWISGICLLVLAVVTILTHIKDRPEFHEEAGK